MEDLPGEEGWQFEPKWDGFRCVAFRAGLDVELQSKSGKSLARYFPEIAAALRVLPLDRFVLDGELAILAGGALSFDALQDRLHPAESRVRKLSAETPAMLILFDCLATEADGSLLDQPLLRRRAALERFFASLGDQPSLRLTPFTRDAGTARAWLKKAGGSLTALPIIETQAGDVSAYIPTNVISITDGQIFLEADLFFAGVRPAVNVGISVSRVGGSAQVKAMRSVAGRLRLDLAQYRELEAFSSFASDLDAATKKQLERGARTVEILKQPQYHPMPVEEQVMVIYAVTNGFLDQIPVNQIKHWEKDFLAFMGSQFPQVPQKIRTEKVLSKEIEADLKRGIDEFNQKFAPAKR